MQPPKNCQEKILSNFGYIGATNKTCQGKLVRRTDT